MITCFRRAPVTQRVLSAHFGRVSRPRPWSGEKPRVVVAISGNSLLIRFNRKLTEQNGMRNPQIPLAQIHQRSRRPFSCPAPSLSPASSFPPSGFPEASGGRSAFCQILPCPYLRNKDIPVGNHRTGVRIGEQATHTPPLSPVGQRPAAGPHPVVTHTPVI